MNIKALLLLLFIGVSRPLLAGDPANPILFVTQVPMPEEVNTRTITQSYLSCVSPFSNHLGGTAFAGRGGSLWVRFGPNANPAHQQIDLLAAADWSAIPGGKPSFNTVAVRNPCVHWNAGRAVFSMVIGAPSSAADNTEFFWQLYEITLPTQAQLSGTTTKPVLTLVANQPPYNNIMPCYAPDDQIIFSSDRPYNGQAHLRQREEYLGLPTVSGLWKLNPATAALRLLHHSPSGAFSPTVDSFGRLIFINWDHLSRDIEAVTDERDSDTAYGEQAPDNFGGWHRTPNGSGNFADEGASSIFTSGTLYGLGPHLDIFPEPRSVDKRTLKTQFPWAVTISGSLTNVINGITTNIFMPWMINLDGSGGEILNHVGRHEVAGSFTRSFNTDSNLVDLNPGVSAGYGGLVAHNSFGNFMAIREDPLNPGTYFGTDSVDLGSHGAGRIVKLTNAGANVNPDTMLVGYVTVPVSPLPVVKVGMNVTGTTPFSPLPTAETVYRTPVPLKDGNLVASVGTSKQADYNQGTLAAPVSCFSPFRLTSLKPISSGTYGPDITLTSGSGITITSSYYVPGQAQQVQFTNVVAWELDPAEVVTTNVPSTANTATAVVDPIEAGAFTTAQVHLPTFQNWLTANNYALSVSRNVLLRDQHDRQQPFNLRNFWNGQQAVAPGTSGTVYSIAWSQFFQADLRRGYLLSGTSPALGRRVVATPIHDGFAENIQVSGAPAGAVKLGNDSSVAAIVPAGKALTWQLLDNDTNLTSQIKERFWVTFQPGEIRSCANCHGINTANQLGTGRPTNTPQALLDLLAFWKTNHPPGTLQPPNQLVACLKSSSTANIVVQRAGGSTGPATVQYATQNGTALAGIDYVAASGTLSWNDADANPKTIAVALLHPAGTGPTKSFSLNLTLPTYASLAIPSVGVDLTESPLDAFLYSFFGGGANLPGGGLPGDDPDGDGQSNAAEFAAGTSPNDRASVLHANFTPSSGAQAHFTFQALAGKGYTVQYKTSLLDPIWQRYTDIPSTPGGQSVDLTIPTSPNATGFYRVVTPLAP